MAPAIQNHEQNLSHGGILTAGRPDG
jgi:hypothetical protein